MLLNAECTVVSRSILLLFLLIFSLSNKKTTLVSPLSSQDLKSKQDRKRQVAIALKSHVKITRETR